MAGNPFRRFELAPLGAAAGKNIAAVSRVRNSMEVWWIAPNGSVQAAFWYVGQEGWRYYELAPAGSASVTGSITAISRIPNSMEVWWVGPNGSVQDAFWYEGGQWGRFELAPAGSASVTGGITAVSRIPNSMEIWWVGSNGSVQDAFWYEGGQWGRFELAPPGSASVTGDITAVSRIPTSMEVWWTGLDGSVQDAYWYEGGQWGRFELAPTGSASVTGGITAVSRIPNSMEIWWVGPNGSVQDAFWYEGSTGWAHFELAPANSASVTSGMAAVSRVRTSMEVWWAGPNGQVMDGFWYEGQDGWRRYELAPSGSASNTGVFAAVTRIPTSMEIWWVAPNRSVQDAFWYEGANGPFVFTAQIITGGLAALGGWVTVTVNPDGSVRWQGHAHDSGADGYDFGISAILRTPSGRTIALAHSGHVGGTFTSGSRDHDWDMTQRPTAWIAENISDFANAQFQTHLEYSSDIGSALEKAVGWLVKFGVGSVLTPVGAVLFVGVEIGSLISTGSLVPGARLAEGILWMAGPGNTVYAIIAAGIASIGSQTRELTQEEYDWANNEVFLGSLPPRDRLVLTDTIGGGNRAFTFPRYDGKITLNMGESAYHDPRQYRVSDGLKYGQIFIHELVHACQIQHSRTDLSLLADAFASKVCEASGNIPYLYGVSGFDYTTLNLEQQAQVVSDWFAGIPQRSDDHTNHTGTAKDPNSPYFRYINDNLRIGNF